MAAVSDDLESTRKQKQQLSTSDDDEIVRNVVKREDCRMYTGDSIQRILDHYNYETIDALLYDPFPINIRYENITPKKEFPMDYNEMVKPTIGCMFCRQEITLKTGCYRFAQSKHHYDRDIQFVACSDVCPSAFIKSTVTKCRKCERDYLYNIYDESICQLCK